MSHVFQPSGSWATEQALVMLRKGCGICRYTPAQVELPKGSGPRHECRICIRSFYTTCDSRNGVSLSLYQQCVDLNLGKERDLLCSWAHRGAAAGKWGTWQWQTHETLDWLSEGREWLSPIVLLLKSYLRNVPSYFTYFYIDVIRHTHK